MTDIKAREFWIDDILNMQGPSGNIAYFHEQDPEKSHRAVHVIEHSAYQAEVDAHKATKEKLRVVVEALEVVRTKTVTDPAHEVELRARAAFVYKLVIEALAKIGGVS